MYPLTTWLSTAANECYRAQLTPILVVFKQLKHALLLLVKMSVLLVVILK